MIIPVFMNKYERHSEWADISNVGLLFQWASTMQIQVSI